MCGPPDLAALFVSATRVILTVAALAGMSAAYALKDVMVRALQGLARDMRGHFRL